MNTLLLIDSSALIYRFFHALPKLTTPEGIPIQAVYGLTSVLMKILSSKERPDCLAAALDRPEKTFREEKFGDYKIHRPPAPDELVFQIQMLPEIFQVFGIKIFEEPGYEADDILGTLAYSFSSLTPKIIILSGDLDVLQLVSDDAVLAQIIKTGVTETDLYNEGKVVERYGLKPSELTEYKGLVGDPSDNIPGVKGIGPKTATALIKEFGTLENIFDNSALITPTIAKKLENQKETALLSRELSTIKRDVPIKMPRLEDLCLTPLDLPKIGAFLGKLGFESLKKRLANFQVSN